MLSVLVASPYPAMRAGLRVLLEEANISVGGEADSLPALLALLEAASPQLAFFDLALDDEALSSLWRLCAQFPTLPVLALSEAAEGARVLAALQAGARGCLPKTAAAAELAEAARRLAAGESFLHWASATALLQQLRSDSHAALAPERLTGREAQVLQAVSAGLTNKAIALKLGVSEHTVKFHLSAAMSKLGAASRAEAVALAIQRGLISI